MMTNRNEIPILKLEVEVANRANGADFDGAVLDQCQLVILAQALECAQILREFDGLLDHLLQIYGHKTVDVIASERVVVKGVDHTSLVLVGHPLVGRLHRSPGRPTQLFDSTRLHCCEACVWVTQWSLQWICRHFKLKNFVKDFIRNERQIVFTEVLRTNEFSAYSRVICIQFFEVVVRYLFEVGIIVIQCSD